MSTSRAPGKDYKAPVSLLPPRLSVSTAMTDTQVVKLDAHSVEPIPEADKDSTGLGLMDRQRVKMWLRDVYREIDEVGV